MKEHIIIEFKAFWVRDLRLGVLQEFCIEASLQYVQPAIPRDPNYPNTCGSTGNSSP